jgi:hypothetical protein
MKFRSNKFIIGRQDLEAHALCTQAARSINGRADLFIPYGRQGSPFGR